MSCILEKWLLVQWSNGERDVVNVKHLVNQNVNIHTGCALKIFINGKTKTGTLIARCNDRRLLDQMILKRENDDAAAGPSREPEESFRDYSSSGSSWVPDDYDALISEENDIEGESDKSGEQYTIEIPKIKRKVLTPSHRANAVIPNCMNNTNNNTPTNTQTAHAPTKSLIEVFSSITELKLNNATIDVMDILNMRLCFHDLFGMVKNMKELSLNKPIESDLPVIVVDNISENDNGNEESTQSTRNYSNNTMCANKASPSILVANNELNASTSRHESNVSKQKSVDHSGILDKTTREWVPIGSGKTLIHKDKYKKVNWKSYTIATRTLLLAAFPRRTLATHSLTGKKSPAFQNKPAKMCLDPKIVSDVILEITERFEVKENLVRTIITTKCADECKMYKSRMKKKKLPSIQEDNENKENQI